MTLGWAEHLAEAMQRDAFDADRWADYYADLAECFPDGAVLSGNRIILTSEETLVPAGDDAVFLEPGRAEEPALPALPSGLSDQVSFLHGAIDRSGRCADVLSARSATRSISVRILADSWRWQVPICTEVLV